MLCSAAQHMPVITNRRQMQGEKVMTSMVYRLRTKAHVEGACYEAHYKPCLPYELTYFKSFRTCSSSVGASPDVELTLANCHIAVVGNYCPVLKRRLLAT